ncbi:putative uncharacterized protein DDB_G0274435 [Agrilus planipennis]|uniref:Uncharacterized protein n=1 Tax=Agrilus planipennis TaxID=224129 RepID=A0A1W4XCY8_AGRPL|nr:putative uncharacterized protein DDB_G0274435 [Agrilus planipennis]
MENYCKPYTRTTCDKKKRPPRKCSTSSNQQQQQQQQQRQQQSDTSDDEITDQELFAFFDNKFTLLTVEAFRLNREELMANSKAVTEPIEEKDESKDTQKSDDISQSQQEKDDTQKRNYCNRRDSSADDTKKEEDEIQEKETAQQDLQSQQLPTPTACILRSPCAKTKMALTLGTKAHSLALVNKE